MLWEEGGEESSFPSVPALGEPAKEQSVKRTKVRTLPKEEVLGAYTSSTRGSA